MPLVPGLLGGVRGGALETRLDQLADALGGDLPQLRLELLGRHVLRPRRDAIRAGPRRRTGDPWGRRRVTKEAEASEMWLGMYTVLEIAT